MALFGAIQQKHFANELEDLKHSGADRPNSRKEMSSKSSKLRLLNPFVGKDGLIRVGTRILYADVDDQAKYPVILPRDDGNVTTET